ncbi:MAG: hypothetical protein KJ593_00960 [Candidatus Omnitrophica bacterium]|nr:hypothetical protein [Candidatus Omnitrophota bacterium]
MKRIIPILIIGLLSAGCVPLIIGGVGVLGGYAISRDTVAVELSKDTQDIWQAAKDVISDLGFIKNADEEARVIEADVFSSYVIIRIEKLTEATNRLKVKSRKYFMPNIGLAQKIFVKIMQKLDRSYR